MGQAYIFSKNSQEPIVLAYGRHDLGTPHVRFALSPKGLHIIFGEMLSDGRFRFEAGHAEFIPFALYPEAQLVHTGFAWDLTEMRAWIENATAWEMAR